MERNIRESILEKSMLLLAAVIMIAFLFIEITSLWIIQKDGKRAQKLFERMVDSYAGSWERKLQEISKNLLILTNYESGNGDYYYQLCYSQDDLSVEFAKQQMKAALIGVNARYNYELTMFVYIPEKNAYVSAYGSGVNYERQCEIKEKVLLYLKQNKIVNGDNWKVLSVGDVSYLLKIYYVEEGYVGCLYEIENALEELNDSVDAQFLEMKDEHGDTLWRVGNSAGDDSITYVYALDNTMVELNVTVESSWLYSSRGPERFVLIGALVGAIIMIYYTFQMQFKNVFYPLEKLRLAMEHYSAGHFDERLPAVHNTFQIAHLYQTFNNMADQIKNLKIQVYEKELERQRINCQYLKVQIQPHFYTNVLNLIYGMAHVHDDSSIQKLSLACGKFFRYLLGQKGTLVTLEEELRCLNSFVEIQKYRYQDKFETHIDVEDGLKEEMIIPLSIQTFFANSLKHNIMLVPLLKVAVSVERTPQEDIRITVQDNGIGFRREILEKIEKGESIEQDGEHIGIQNIKERIRIFYGEKALLHIQSEPGNTEITLCLPSMTKILINDR